MPGAAGRSLLMILIFFAFQRYFIEGIATTGSTGR
jgi:ABC-type glycerol-3-phosphate transport system permease component